MVYERALAESACSGLVVHVPDGSEAAAILDAADVLGNIGPVLYLVRSDGTIGGASW
jgi:hypothetical protein